MLRQHVKLAAGNTYISLSLIEPESARWRSNITQLQWPFDIKPTSAHIYRRFKEHDLITCESKVQVVVSLGVIKFCSPQGVMTHDT